MNQQTTLFDLPPLPATAPLNPTADPLAAPRLTRQQAELIARLRLGRATNAELSGIAMRFGARLKELRDVGHDVRIVHHDRASGLVTYALHINGKEAGL